MFGRPMVVALKNLRTEIEGDVKDAVDALAQTRGMSIRAITERTFDWLTKQPDEIQAVILGQIPSTPDFLAVVVARMATSHHPAAPARKEGSRQLKGGETGEDVPPLQPASARKPKAAGR